MSNGHSTLVRVALRAAVAVLPCALSACAAPAPDDGAKTVDTLAIVGGHEATPHSQPWIAGLRWDGKIRCGAVLIESKWLLTAAHCFDDENYSNMTVVLGEHDVGKRESGEQRRAIALVFPHDDYDRATYINDIALVELASPVRLTDTVQTIQTRPIVELPQQVQAAGWGKTSDGTLSRTLQEITLDVLPQDACLDSRIGPNEFCAGSWGLGEAQDTCGGDSGGPVFFRAEGGPPVLVGITSRGLDYCDGRGVYTSVDAYYGWFRNLIDTSI